MKSKKVVVQKGKTSLTKNDRVVAQQTTVTVTNPSPIEENEIKDDQDELFLDQSFLENMIIAQAIATPKGKLGNKIR